MRKKSNKQNKFLIQILLAPIKILSKARDFYMKSMQDCAGRVEYSAVVFGGPTTNSSHSLYLPKSFSVSNSSQSMKDEELRQLLRRELASLNNKHNRQGEVLRETTIGCSEMGKSYSVGLGKIGRIDEDRPCSFREDDSVDLDLFPRSTSHAVRRRIVVYY